MNASFKKLRKIDFCLLRECVAHVYMHCGHALVTLFRRGRQISEEWSYRQLSATMWVLRTRPGSARKAGSARNHRAISPVPVVSNNNGFVICVCQKVLRIFLFTDKEGNVQGSRSVASVSQARVLVFRFLHQDCHGDSWLQTKKILSLSSVLARVWGLNIPASNERNTPKLINSLWIVK